jgi:cell division protein FtsL
MQLRGKLGSAMIEQKKKFADTLLHFAPLLMVVFVALLLVHDIFGTHGYLAMRQKQQEIQRVRHELEKLDKENTELQQNVQDLKSDPETIRKIAREEYGLAGHAETIIKLPAPKPAPVPAVKP